LEEVIHYPQAVEAGFVGCQANFCQARTNLLGPSWPGKAGDLQSDSHGKLSF
jgi:hypothetical protein